MVSSATRYTVTFDVGEVGVKRDIDRIARVDLGEDLMNLANEGNDVTVARVVESPVGAENDAAFGSHDVGVQSRCA